MEDEAGQEGKLNSDQGGIAAFPHPVGTEEMFCTSCGNQIRQDAKFCEGCGAVILASAPVAPSVQFSASKTGPSAAKPRLFSPQWTAERREKNRRQWSLIGKIVAFCLAPFVLLFAMFLVFAVYHYITTPAAQLEREHAERLAKGASVAQERAIATEPPLSKGIRTQSDFEHSEFCRQYHCKETDHRPVRNGDENHSYETSLTQVSVELQTNTNSNPTVTGLGLSFYERDRLSDEDFNAINALVRSTDQTAKHDKTTSFIRENVENAVCPACQVDQSAKSTGDGNFRIWAGKSGDDQVVSFKSVSLDKEAVYSQPGKMSDADLLNHADSLLAGATIDRVSEEHEGEAALYLSEFNRRHPNSNNGHAKKIGEQIASLRRARDQVYLDAAKARRAAELDAKIDRQSAGREAKVKCRVSVTEHLKAPSSADFQSYAEDDVEYMGNGVFRVQTKVDAVNSFGAKLRSKFDCEVQCDIEKNCTVTDLKQM